MSCYITLCFLNSVFVRYCRNKHIGILTITRKSIDLIRFFCYFGDVFGSIIVMLHPFPGFFLSYLYNLYVQYTYHVLKRMLVSFRPRTERRLSA